MDYQRHGQFALVEHESCWAIWELENSDHPIPICISSSGHIAREVYKRLVSNTPIGEVPDYDEPEGMTD